MLELPLSQLTINAIVAAAITFERRHNSSMKNETVSPTLKLATLVEELGYLARAISFENQIKIQHHLLQISALTALWLEIY